MLGLLLTLFLSLLPLPFQELETSIANEEQTLCHIKGLAEAVRANTTPLGAEELTQEMKELWAAWERLRVSLHEARGRLQSSLDSRGQYQAQCEQLWAGIRDMRALVQRLARELEGKVGDGGGDRTEEQLVAQWRRCTVSV